ncbi:MAG: hypothetical protein IPN32_18480 [Deltaproteobacteria bacterium]|nr:hypothetical protein [Deltaproteobacteria bacterium]
MNTNTAHPDVRARLGAAMAITWLTTACGTEAPQSPTGTSTDASASATSTDAMSSGVDGSTSTGTSSTGVTTDASSSSGSGSDSDSDSDSGSTTDDGLHDGCWDHSFEGSSSKEPVEPPWDAFTCDGLPTPCSAVELSVTRETGALTIDETALTPAEVAAADDNVRCMLQALRDATPGQYTVEWAIDAGFSSSRTHYYVLDDGVVASSSARQDFVEWYFEAYRSLVDVSTFDPCIDEPDLITAASCLAPPAEKGLSLAQVPVLDADVCIDAVPACTP